MRMHYRSALIDPHNHENDVEEKEKEEKGVGMFLLRVLLTHLLFNFVIVCYVSSLHPIVCFFGGKDISCHLRFTSSKI